MKHKDWIRTTYAHQQLAHIIVSLRQAFEDVKVLHRTPQYDQVVEILFTVAREALETYERGEILEVLINSYTPLHLPGFDEQLEENENSRQEGRE